MLIHEIKYSIGSLQEIELKLVPTHQNECIYHTQRLKFWISSGMEDRQFLL